MNIVRIDPGTSLHKLPILWSSPPCLPNPLLPIICQSALPAVLHFFHLWLWISSNINSPLNHIQMDILLFCIQETSRVLNMLAFLVLPDQPLITTQWINMETGTLFTSSWQGQNWQWINCMCQSYLVLKNLPKTHTYSAVKVSVPYRFILFLCHTYTATVFTRVNSIW